MYLDHSHQFWSLLEENLTIWSRCRLLLQWEWWNQLSAYCFLRGNRHSVIFQQFSGKSETNAQNLWNRYGYPFILYLWNKCAQNHKLIIYQRTFALIIVFVCEVKDNDSWPLHYYLYSKQLIHLNTNIRDTVVCESRSRLSWTLQAPLEVPPLTSSHLHLMQIHCEGWQRTKILSTPKPLREYFSIQLNLKTYIYSEQIDVKTPIVSIWGRKAVVFKGEDKQSSHIDCALVILPF